MENVFSADDLKYKIVDKKDIKFMNIMRDDQIIKTQVGLPVFMKKKFSLSLNVGDITKGFAISGGFKWEKPIQYEWTQIAIPEKDITTTGNNAR